MFVAALDQLLSQIWGIARGPNFSFEVRKLYMLCAMSDKSVFLCYSHCCAVFQAG